MAQPKQRISEMSTEELQQKLVLYRFLRDYFHRGKNPQFWLELVVRVEQELTKRGALY